MSVNKTIRVNVSISQDIKKYFEDKSKKVGVSQSALMAMALGQYIEQEKVILEAIANNCLDELSPLKIRDNRK